MTEQTHITFGCDPELFIKRGGQIVGSEEVIGGGIDSGRGTIIVDGVQAELNPEPSTCREVLGRSIVACLNALNDRMGMQYSIDFSRGVKIDENTFMQLPPSCKQFGCKPSFNVMKDGGSIADVDPKVYTFRSAGGHIHLGSDDEFERAILKNYGVIVRVLDIVLGNTSVLLDQSPVNAERRKHYGLAGEYRMPSYGVEYRTLSNFWMQSYPLMSLVFGLARWGVDIVASGLESQLFDLVNYDDVVRAINENDVELAWKNWYSIREFIVAHIDPDMNEEMDYRYPIDARNIVNFEEFVRLGPDSFFSQDIMSNWLKANMSEPEGFYEFLKNNV